MKILHKQFTSPTEVCQWMKDNIYDWSSRLELLSMVKDQGVYEIFYKKHEEVDDLL